MLFGAWQTMFEPHIIYAFIFSLVRIEGRYLVYSDINTERKNCPFSLIHQSAVALLTFLKSLPWFVVVDS